MEYEIKVSKVVSIPATSEQVTKGLLAYISCVFNGRIHLGSLTLRRTARGELRIAFPSRRDKRGKRHYYSHPCDDVARREIEHQILVALNLDSQTLERLRKRA